MECGVKSRVSISFSPQVCENQWRLARHNCHSAGINYVETRLAPHQASTYEYSNRIEFKEENGSCVIHSRYCWRSFWF